MLRLTQGVPSSYEVRSGLLLTKKISMCQDILTAAY